MKILLSLMIFYYPYSILFAEKVPVKYNTAYKIKKYDGNYSVNPDKDILITIGNEIVIFTVLDENKINTKKDSDLLKDVWIEE